MMLSYCSHVLQKKKDHVSFRDAYAHNIYLLGSWYCIPSRPCWIKNIRQRYIYDMCFLAGGRLPWFGENEVFFIWSQQLKRFCQFQLCPCVCMISAYFTDWRSFKPVEVELELWQGVAVPGSGNGVAILEAFLGICAWAGTLLSIHPMYLI